MAAWFEQRPVLAQAVSFTALLPRFAPLRVSDNSIYFPFALPIVGAPAASAPCFFYFGSYVFDTPTKFCGLPGCAKRVCPCRTPIQSKGERE
jgi:hypothetical protein